MAAEVDVRGAGWRSKKLRCPCFNDKRQNIRSPDWFNSSPAPHIKDLLCYSVFGGLRVTGWCPGCPPSSCCPLPRHSPRSQRKGVWGSRPAPASWRARTPTCFRWGQTTGGAPPPPTASTAEKAWLWKENKKEIRNNTEWVKRTAAQNKRHFQYNALFSLVSPANHHTSSLSTPHPTLLPVRVCSFLWRISLLRSSHPSPDGHDRNTSASWEGTEISVSILQVRACCFSYKRWELLWSVWMFSHLVLRIILEGTGPRILSIMAKCSLLSWVWKQYELDNHDSAGKRNRHKGREWIRRQSGFNSCHFCCFIQYETQSELTNYTRG